MTVVRGPPGRHRDGRRPTWRTEYVPGVNEARGSGAMLSEPQVLVLGHVTRDEFGGLSRTGVGDHPGEEGQDVRLGGAAGFVARAAVVFGLRTALVTAGPPASRLLQELRELDGLTMHLVASDQMTTFAIDYSGTVRRLMLRAAAPPLRPDHVPDQLRRAPVMYVGPVAGECDRALVESLGRDAFVAVGLQGWLRTASPEGRIQPHRHPEVDQPPANLRVAVLSEEDHPEAEAIAARLAARGVIVALTRAARGATVFTNDGQIPIAVHPAREVDPTGAGDVFGLCFAVGLGRGLSPEAAGQLAALAAARVVEGPGLGTLTAATAPRLAPRLQEGWCQMPDSTGR
jgi:1D-myo-inositol 3-kinase